MSADVKPRILGLVDATASNRLGDLRPNATDAEMVDLLATWLAEVSAEATLRPPVKEAEPARAEPTR